MAIFLTGSTGYLGSYLAAGLFTGHRESLNLLVRAKTQQEARERLWTSLQLHFTFPEFFEFLSTRTRLFLGDLTAERFGLPDDEYRALVDSTDSVIHCAASLNRKSEKQCLNVNLRGTLEVIQLARRAQNHHGLRRYSHVSTVAVAGHRHNEVVTEDVAIDWARSDYDPYARTKKFCEHMAAQLLPDVTRTIFRPAIVLGDSRRPETSQFDMVQAFDILSRFPVLPLRADDKIDIVPANYVGAAIVAIHQKAQPAHGIYHLSSGAGSQTYRELTDALSKEGSTRRPAYVPALGRIFSRAVSSMAKRRNNVGYAASLLKVFWPYLTWNTVFDNSRVVAEMNEAPAKFTTYGHALLKFSRENHFKYPAKPWPVTTTAPLVAVAGGRSRMTDFLLVAWVSALIEITRLGWTFGLGKRWRRGEKLRLLFAGYNGTRNTGSDVRVQEMIRQIRHVLGPDNVDFSVMSQDFERTKGYFEGTRQVHLPDMFPPFLYREVRANHGVVACEGSMFKSKFANALTTMMIGSLGLASAENKLSLAYGGEAGHMDRMIQDMCARYVKDSLVITRNVESQKLLSQLGIPTELGTDTAWTFEPKSPEYANNVLRQAGWDGQTPILVLCPIHPFVWPVKASIAKYIARVTTGAYKEAQYRTVYFHESGAEVDRKFQNYISAYTNATKAFCARHKVFPILVAMERLDAVACREIATHIPGTPIFTSDDYNMFELVAILRACTYMVSSRYHGIVTSMPSQVVSAGVTMDERIRNLMRERGHSHLFLTVEDPALETKLLRVMETLVVEAEAIREGIAQTVVRNLKVMARMGTYLEDAIRNTYPEFPLRQGVLTWQDYLPPLSENLLRLVERYDAHSTALPHAAAENTVGAAVGLASSNASGGVPR